MTFMDVLTHPGILRRRAAGNPPAGIELRDRVGSDNFFLFGLTAAEVAQTKVWGHRPWDYYHANAELKTAIDQIASGYFSQGDTTLFQPLIDSLKNRDDYRVFADYQAYIDAQKQVSQVYRHPEQWVRQSILNTARIGYFSSDRAIREYAQDIWHLKPVPVVLEEPQGEGQRQEDAIARATN